MCERMRMEEYQSIGKYPFHGQKSGRLSDQHCRTTNRPPTRRKPVMNSLGRSIDGSIPVQALLYPDETLVASQGNIGLYDGWVSCFLLAAARPVSSPPLPVQESEGSKSPERIDTPYVAQIDLRRQSASAQAIVGICTLRRPPI